MTEWIRELADLASAGESSVLVTVAGIRGSAPRETGAKMIVTARETVGSIGGGQLEYQCAAHAVEMLAAKDRGTDKRRFSLGANCGQCCGGVVEVMFERLAESRAAWLDRVSVQFRDREPVVIATHLDDPGQKVVVCPQEPADDFAARAAAIQLLSNDDAACIVNDWLLEPVRQTAFQVAVFGAGHVGTATVDLLKNLDCEVRWIDSRRNAFPKRLPAHITAIESPDPSREVAAMPPGSIYLVMTHSHPLDLDVCASVLRRDDAKYCGVIGSVSKRRRFDRLLKKQGVTDSAIAGLKCPIGVAGISSKQPAEIAVGVVAELLQVRDQSAARHDCQPFLEVYS